MESRRRAARIFKTLSSETRLGILQLLKDRALCVGALAERLGVSSAAVSQHLRILRNLDAVVPEKRGYHVHYRLNPETLRQWRQATEELLEPEEE
ncbi:MAG: metalloregulator ArsR/SmtB family transcription factor [Candidatus Brocadiaceae bacterium]|jgi:DNA-binding transcriptional ArsR family regulator